MRTVSHNVKEYRIKIINHTEATQAENHHLGVTGPTPRSDPILLGLEPERRP
jgi:hypothetical protein